MTNIETPKSNNSNIEQGGSVPPAEQQPTYYGPDTETEFPQQRDRTTSPEYTIPEHEEEKPGFFQRKAVRAGLAVTGLAAAAGAYFAGAASHDSDPTPQNGSQPVATAEQNPGSTAASAPSAEAPASSVEQSPDAGITINGQMLPKEVVEDTYFKVDRSKAPSPNAAGDAWATSLQNGMRINVSRTAVSQGGGAEATKQKNLELLTGSDGIMLGLGKDHNKVSSVPTDFMEPGTLVYNFNKANIDNETTSQVFLTGERVTQDGANSYTVLGDLTITTLDGDVAAKSVTYKAEVHEKLNPETGEWNYTGSHIVKH